MGFAVKINGSGPVGAAAAPARRRAGRSDGASFRTALDVREPDAAPLHGGGPLTAVTGLLALQEAPDATTGRSKGLARAEEMLAQLEDIRRGLILGAIPVQGLRNLAAAVRRQKQSTGDPALNQILGEIELRAEVELAKLGFRS